MANDVANLYDQKLHLCRLQQEEQQRAEFKNLIFRFHKLRRFRNQILHSAFVELKGAGEVMALMRSNPRLIQDPEICNETMDQRVLSTTPFNSEMTEMGEVAYGLGQHYLQLVHRLPTE